MRAALLFLMLTLAAPATAAERATYDFYLGAVRAAELHLWPEISGGRYKVLSRVETTGLVGTLFRFRIDGDVRGRVRGGDLRPDVYAARAVGGRRIFDIAMRYFGGVPKVERLEVEDEDRGVPLDAATQGGTLDPLSATFALFRDLPREALCTQRLTVFDGRRRSEIVLAGDLTDQMRCTGTYRRVAGFTEEEMAEQTEFPLTLRYRKAGDGLYHVDQFRFRSSYGTAVLDRR